MKLPVVLVFGFVLYSSASAQNFRQAAGLQFSEYPVLYQNQRILSLTYTPGIQFDGRSSYLALTMPLKTGKVLPNWRPLNEYYRGLYIELALAAELGYEAGLLKKYNSQVFVGLAVSGTNFNYVFQNSNSAFIDLYVGLRRKLTRGALEIQFAAGEPFRSAAKRYTLGLAYVLP